MKDFSVPAIQKRCRGISRFEDIFSSGLPSIGNIRRRYGYDFTQAYIEIWIVNLREFINVGKKMNDEQTRETASLILDTYPFMNLADIHFIFKSAKLGRFGKQYDRLDGQLILSWFEEHFGKRCNAAAETAIMEADKYRHGSDYLMERIHKHA
ncbi:MAG: hypothetical protein LBQ78_00570 [Tannerellaceae bacterium]|nr:hypothetical protein [Tannerellaceae bacterium]